jgi:hypothetical protein
MMEIRNHCVSDSDAAPAAKQTHAGPIEIKADHESNAAQAKAVRPSRINP